MQNSSASKPAHWISRQHFLRLLGAGALSVVTMPFLAGCKRMFRPAAASMYLPVTSDRARWAASADLNIAIYATDAPARWLTSSGKDFKPSWSPDGSLLTFFRTSRYGKEFKDWRSKICVIRADGTGFRELTSDDAPNFNPTWTRDGSNRIIFNRLVSGQRNRIYWTSPSASVGDEELISDPQFPYYEWANSALRDGRIFIDRNDGTFRSYLLTPNPGKKGKYEQIERPTDHVWHKLSVSPSETQVAYMLDDDNYIPTYEDAVICYAQFDVAALKIHQQVAITQMRTSSIEEYPTWNRDESLLLYDSNQSGVYQVYAYRFADCVTSVISPDKLTANQFADYEGLPK